MRWKSASRAFRAAMCAAGIACVACAQQAPKPAAPVQSEADLRAPTSANAELHHCLELIERRDYAGASQAAHAYLAAHSESAEGHFLLGYILYRQDKPRESLAEYTTGAHFHKPDANDLAVVAMDYVLLRDYVDADKWLTLATSWSPLDELYCYYLGRTRYAENHFQSAIAVFQKCLTLMPHDIRVEYNMGLAYAGLGQYDAAAADYRTAIAWEQKTAGRDPQPYLDLGILLLQQGDPGKALPDLQRAAAFDPQNPRAREQLGRTWEQLHNYAEADKEMHAAVMLAPNIPALHFEMGRIYQKEGLRTQAKAEFARCAALVAAHSTDAEETPNPAPRH